MIFGELSKLWWAPVLQVSICKPECSEGENSGGVKMAKEFNFGNENASISWSFYSGLLVYVRRTFLWLGHWEWNQILRLAVFCPVISVLCLSPSASSFFLLPLLYLQGQCNTGILILGILSLPKLDWCVKCQVPRRRTQCWLMACLQPELQPGPEAAFINRSFFEEPDVLTSRLSLRPSCGSSKSKC